MFPQKSNYRHKIAMRISYILLIYIIQLISLEKIMFNKVMCSNKHSILYREKLVNIKLYKQR